MEDPLKEDQRMADVPRTPEEKARRKGPMPLRAIFLAVGLLAALLLFFLPIFNP